MTTTTEKSVAEVQADTLTAQVKTLKIITNEDRTAAEDMLQNAKTLEDQIFAYLDPPRAKAYEDYQYHKARLDAAINPVKDARKTLKQLCVSFDQEQERIRREEQARLEAEARKRAEDEALASAAQAEAEGDTATAEAIISEPVQIAPVVAPRTAPAPSRLSAGRTIWSAEVTNLMALVKAIADGKQSITLIEANIPALNKMATALKSSMNIPGVVAKSKTV
jgi:hypothetical protein